MDQRVHCDEVFMPNNEIGKTVISRRMLLVLGGLASASELFARTPITGMLAPHQPEPEDQSANESACIYWNTRARQLVSKHGQDPVYASRTYAHLSLAQAFAAHVVSHAPVVRKEREHHSKFVNFGVSVASIRFLSHLFPGDIEFDQRVQELSANLKSSRLSSQDINTIVDLSVGGANRVKDYRAADGADKEVEVIAPKGREYWYSFENRPPIRPYWGNVKTLCIDSAEKYVPGPPPAFDSPEFKSAVADVRQKSSNITPDQLAMVHHWADGAGSPTPSGHWNLLACDFLSNSKKSETERARILALLNIAMLDAGIACWRTKFKYWLARPSQVDPNISVRIKVPNFPSYVSGHSSFSGSAATVLSHFFPEQRERFKGMANQASQSRVLCGIHFKFDCEDGLRMGRQIGKFVVSTLPSSQSLVQLLERRSD